jgi:GT2 family glycosyltransferase
MDVSVVIVNWNTEDLLFNCLKSIYEHTRDVQFEVIVVDNASTDGSVIMIKKHFPQTILFANKANYGFATANNQGIAVSNGRYILLLNSDTVLIENTIFNVYKFANNQTDAAVVGCKILNGDRSLQGSAFLFPSLLNFFLLVVYLAKIFPSNRFFGRERMGWWGWNDVREVDVLVGCFMFVRMKAIEEVGPMDSQFFMYYEETDWCYRFKQAGWKILYAPISNVIHFGGGSSKKNPNKMLLQKYSSMLLYYKKHKGALVYAVACALLMLNFSLRIPYWLIHSLTFKNTMKSDLNTVKLYASGIMKTLHGWRGLHITNNS